ncbi:hypothetical protein PS2_034744 [Malus domestica]
MGVQEEELHQVIEDSLILSFTGSFCLIKEVRGKVPHMLAWLKTRHGISLVTLKSSRSTWKFRNGKFLVSHGVVHLPLHMANHNMIRLLELFLEGFFF